MNLFEHAENNIQTEIETLRAEINRHNELYYQKSVPEISDVEFDALLEKFSPRTEDAKNFALRNRVLYLTKIGLRKIISELSTKSALSNNIFSQTNFFWVY